MKDALYHLMFKLVTKGPQPVSECGEIEAISAALNLDMITVNPCGEVDWYHITSNGIQTLLDNYEKRPDPEETIFGAVYIKHAEITGDGQLDGTPLVILGGALEWSKEYLLGSKLTFSSCFSTYDYATFDYLDEDAKTWLMKPGDWLILSEDHNHKLHQFFTSEDEE